MTTDPDISIVLAASVRYALGRSSYVVPVVQHFLRRHLDNEFVRRDLKLYMRDIKSYLDENKDEESFTRSSWEKLHDELLELSS